MPRFKVGDIIKSSYEGDIVLAQITSLDDEENWEATVTKKIQGRTDEGKKLADDNWDGVSLYFRKNSKVKLKGFKFKAKNKKHIETIITKL